jgi:hypothetical protein
MPSRRGQRGPSSLCLLPSRARGQDGWVAEASALEGGTSPCGCPWRTPRSPPPPVAVVGAVSVLSSFCLALFLSAVSQASSMFCPETEMCNVFSASKMLKRCVDSVTSTRMDSMGDTDSKNELRFERKKSNERLKQQLKFPSDQSGSDSCMPSVRKNKTARPHTDGLLSFLLGRWADLSEGSRRMFYDAPGCEKHGLACRGP